MTTALKRVEPSRHLYQGHQYVTASQTDLRAKWQSWFDSLSAPANADEYQRDEIAEHQAPQIPGNY